MIFNSHPDLFYSNDMYQEDFDRYAFYEQPKWGKEKSYVSIQITECSANTSTARGSDIEYSSNNELSENDNIDKSSVYADTNEELSDSAEQTGFKDELQIIQESVADSTTDLNKLIEEYIFAEIPDGGLTPEITTVSKKGKRMWKRDSAKNTLEIRYQESKDWSSQSFRTELGKQVGYTQHQIYKWWAYRLTKDGMKVSTFSRKSK